MRARDRKKGERARRARRRRRSRASRRPSVLQALTTSTLALPGIAGSVAAESPTDQVTADYSYARYQEDPLKSSQVTAGGETRRYDIEIHQMRLSAPVTDRMDFSLDAGYETMTGATPWYINRPDTQAGETHPRVVMTGASIEDARTDALLKGTYYLDRGTAALSAGFSTEDDFWSVSGGLEGTRGYNEKNTTLSGGIGFTEDQINPVQDGTPGRPHHAEKHSISGNIGLSQVLSRTSTFQSTLTYQYTGGFLSDPYKEVYVGGPILPDSRPSQRHQLTWLTRFRRHFEGLGGSLHLDYSLYWDDWNINAHTIEAAWYQSLFGVVRLIPSVRYYSQSQADFYAPWFDSAPGDGLYSSDYRLSPFGALSYKIRAETRFQTWSLDWVLNVGYERYESSGKYAIQKVSIENPALVSFDLFSAGFTARF